ncbi:glutathione S-transferase family protein [Aphanothece sacrum]|uniref:Glutathione S-transferase n=1 Tax=Aphanothece sacrum FPU1 TaxID=1920663 RepID=A0A401IDZ8_APHSA|nr:glutathione S-transferase family protein [Aphanothece sacrum]GBF79390.1 glutathione S-transferase [Aphanothece sacrum FPU1]GBF86891.1 glutathione S-transferase [Aphanothece sacrum FPU3]
MLKLYGGKRSRASIVQWYLEELEVPYEFVLLDMENGEHRQPEFLDINPMGKVPAILDDDFKLWESGAILLYLAEKYEQLPDYLAGRSIMTQWVLFGNSTLATGLFVEASREREAPKLLATLNQIFESHAYLLGNQFTVADVAVGSILAYIPIMLKLDLSSYPAVLAYIQRINERPAFQKTIGQPTA